MRRLISLRASIAMRSIVGLCTAQAFNIAISIPVSILIIRYLGPEQYGIFGIASAVVLMFAALSGIPTSSLIVRELARAGDSGASRVLTAAVGLKLIGSLIQIVLSLGAIALLGYRGEVASVAMLTALAYLASPASVLQAAMEYDGRFVRIASIEVGAALARAACRLTLVMIEAQLLWFAVAALFDATVQLVLYLWVNPNRRGQIKSLASLSRPLARGFVREGWPLVLTGMAIWLYTRSDVLIISKLLGDRETGIYSAGIRFVEVAYFFPSAISSYFAPQLARAGDSGYYDRLTTMAAATIWTGIFIAASLAVLGPLMLPLLIGSRFDGCGTVLAIAAWTIPLIGLGVALSASLTMSHATRVPLYSALTGGLVNIALNFTLIPMIGIAGAALATVLAQVIAVGTTFAIYRDPALLRAVLAALSPAIVWRLAVRAADRQQGK